MELFMNLRGKNTLIAAAVAAALGSSSAYAVAPSVAPGDVEYFGGGSAQANAFYVAACKLMTNVDVISDAAAVLSGDYYILYGTLSATTGTVAAGTNVMMIYKFNGGSFANGLAPDANAGATTLIYPTLASIQAAAAVAGTTAGTACTTGLPTFSMTNTLETTGRAPDFGLTDVEPSMFQHLNNPSLADAGYPKNDDGGLPPATSSDGIYDNLFGVAVTATVYAGAGHPKTNFSRAEMEGIIAGTISDWSQVYDDNGAALPAGGIIFLDRGEGSGTKASGSQYFLGYPGAGASAQLPFSATGGYCTAGKTLTLCDAAFGQISLDIAEGSTNAIISDLALAQSKGLRAIAVLGLENPPAKNQVGGANTYDFTKIDGVAVDTGAVGDNINGTTATSYVNVVKGYYDFYFQNSFNQRSTLAGNPLAFANAFKTQMTLATFVGANAGVGFPTAVSGTLLDADKAAALAKGVTLNTRNKVSTAPLQPFFTATSGAIPVSSDPL
jgi:hypothetical protein